MRQEQQSRAPEARAVRAGCSFQAIWSSPFGGVIEWAAQAVERVGDRRGVGRGRIQVAVDQQLTALTALQPIMAAATVQERLVEVARRARQEIVARTAVQLAVGIPRP